MVHGSIFLLVVILIPAFFRFVSSLRHVGAAAVMLGAAPDPSLQDVGEEEIYRTSDRKARFVAMAAHRFNYGIGSYFFLPRCWLGLSTRGSSLRPKLLWFTCCPVGNFALQP